MRSGLESLLPVNARQYSKGRVIQSTIILACFGKTAVKVFMDAAELPVKLLSFTSFSVSFVKTFLFRTMCQLSVA